MNEATGLQIALGLLKYAVLAAPAIGEVVRTAIAAFEPQTPEQQSLVDQIKGVLPGVGESDKALGELIEDGYRVNP